MIKENYRGSLFYFIFSLFSSPLQCILTVYYPNRIIKTWISITSVKDYSKDIAKLAEKKKKTLKSFWFRPIWYLWNDNIYVSVQYIDILLKYLGLVSLFMLYFSKCPFCFM